MTTQPLIEMRKVKKSFDNNHILKGVDLSIYEGEITAVIGKSGSGKSVLLKHIIGLLEMDSGSILISGIPNTEMDSHEKKRFKRKLSYMFQDNALFDFMNIYDNIALPLSENKKFPKREIADKVKTLINQLGIEGIDTKFPSQISGGMRKRVALARALITDPKVVLFDEPTTGLDPIRKRNVHSMIHEHQKQFGFTAVIVTHDIPKIFDIAQRIAMLDDGVIKFEGTKEQILSTDNNVVQAFIEGIDLR